MDSLLEGDPSREGDPEDASGNGKKAAKISVRRRSNEIVKNFLIVAVYLLVGGLVFKAVESGPEKDRREEDWVVLSTLKVDGGASLTSDADSAKEFRAVLAGLHSSCELKSPERDYDFDFQGSMFFALTVVTTIGYGNFVPTTVFGMWLVVVYAIFGISLILTFIFQTAHLYVMIVKGLLQRFAKLKVRAKRGVAHELSFANYCGNGTEVNAKDLRSALEDLAGCDGMFCISTFFFPKIKIKKQTTIPLHRRWTAPAVSSLFHIIQLTYFMLSFSWVQSEISITTIFYRLSLALDSSLQI